MRASVLAIAASLAACSQGAEGVDVEDRFVQGANPLVDVLFVVDDSNSMAAPQESLALATPGFLGALTAASADWQIGVVTTDLDAPTERGRLRGDPAVLTAATPDVAAKLADRFRAGTGGSTMERGLGAAEAAVTPPLSTHDNTGLLRDGARLAIVVVSDEDDCTDDYGLPEQVSTECVQYPGLLVPVDTALERLRAAVASSLDLTVHALVDTGVTDEFEGCGGGSPGLRYVEAARRTGGFVRPLCADAPSMLGALALELAGQRSSVPLSSVPDPETLVVRIVGSAGGDGEVVAATSNYDDGYMYDAAANALRLFGSAVPPQGSTLVASYRLGI